MRTNRGLKIGLAVASLVVLASLIVTGIWSWRAEGIADLARKIGNAIDPMPKSRGDLKAVSDEFKQMTLDGKIPDAKWVQKAKSALRSAEEKTAALEEVLQEVEKQAAAKGWLAGGDLPRTLKAARTIAQQHRRDIELVRPMVDVAASTSQTMELAQRIAAVTEDLDQILTGLQKQPLSPRYKQALDHLADVSRRAQAVTSDVNMLDASLSKARPGLSPRENEALQGLSAPLREGLGKVQERLDRAKAIIARNSA